MADPYVDSKQQMDLRSGRNWHRELNRYHWFVLGVAALGWMFDCLDQQLFNLARVPAMKELVGSQNVAEYGGYATAIFLMGWATGGIAFGILGDRIGRARVMLLTILVYSLFTGLSALSVGFWDFAFYRFLTGLGVGGEFAVGVALVAEIMPDRARPFALALLQALSAVGNITAALVSISLGSLEEGGALGEYALYPGGPALSAWRLMFLVGTLPALLAIVIRRRLKEPERWQAVARDASSASGAKSLGSFAELFGDPRWRRRAIVGMILASSGVIGLWGIGFFAIDYNRGVFQGYYVRQAREAGEADRDQDFLLQAMQDPAGLAALQERFQSADLISPHAGSRSERVDAERIYQGILELRRPNAPEEGDNRSGAVTIDEVMAKLDESTASRKAQSAEKRRRREDYLASPMSGTPSTLAAHGDRIAARTKVINGSLTRWSGITSLTLNFGEFFGIYTFGRVTHHLGRRRTFAISFVAAALGTILVFGFLDDSTLTIAGVTIFTDVFWMIPIMGFCQLSIFGGYAIYFPELFPTRLRSTGTSFCYNVGRFVAAGGPLTLGLLASRIFENEEQPLQLAGLTMCSIFVVGLLVLPFAPETNGKPLPE